MQSDPLGFDAGLNFYVYANGNPVNLVDPLGLIMSAGELGIGNPGSYGSYNTNDSMYGSNGTGTNNDWYGRDDNGEPVDPPAGIPGIHTPEYLKSEKIADKANPAMWADPWAAAIMEAQGHENPLAQSSQNEGPTPKATKPNPAPLSVDDIIDSIVKNKNEPFKADPFNFFNYDQRAIRHVWTT